MTAPRHAARALAQGQGGGTAQALSLCLRLAPTASWAGITNRHSNTSIPSVCPAHTSGSGCRIGSATRNVHGGRPTWLTGCPWF